MKTLPEFEQFIDWCRKSTVKGVADWYKNKVPYKWFWSGLTQVKTRMPKEHWEIVPSHTNLVETAHVETNAATGIQLHLVTL